MSSAAGDTSVSAGDRSHVLASRRPYSGVKRTFDVAFSACALVLLSPLFLLIGAAVRSTSRGPVFYRGQRVGRHNRDFAMLKFRTMVADADRLGGSSTPDDDPRLAPVGRFLRRFKLDELPQLINVLRGEMSLVGPRPQVRWAVDRWDSENAALLAVRPGMTDYASLAFHNEGEILRGSADPDRTYLEKIEPAKSRLGLYYVRHASFLTDLKIILATVLLLFGVSPSWCIPAVEGLNVGTSNGEEYG